MRKNLGLLLLGLAMLIPFTPFTTASPGESAVEYVKRGSDWYRLETGREFLVNPEVISVRFLAPIDDLAGFTLRASNLKAGERAMINGLETVRSNRLGIHDLRITDGSDVFDVLAAIRKTGLVEFAEENTFGYYEATPNDSLFNQCWGLDNQGQTGGTPNADVNGPEAWDINVGDPNVIVAILDSGTEVSHVDLNDNIWVNPGEIPGNGQDDDNNGRVDDINGWDFVNNNNNVAGPFWHGTHVAGVCAAETNNGTGIAGLAGGFNGGDGVRMLIGGVGDFGPDGSILDDAILYSADEGALVITMSLSVGTSSAIDAALQDVYENQNVFVDCSAGNGGGPGVGYPARNEYVVAVGATDDNDNRAGFSSTGPEVEVAAPGVDILSTQSGNSYASSDGTSFSSPFVAGLAGLIYSAAPGITNDFVREVIQDTCVDLGAPGRDNDFGFGRIDAETALLSVGSTDPPIMNSLTPDSGAVNVGTAVTISGQNFIGSPQVNFGGTAATFVTLVNDTTIIAGAPVGTIMESVDVDVTTPFGSDNIVDGYSYVGILNSFGSPSVGEEITYSGLGVPNGDWGVVIDYVAGNRVKKGMNFRIDFSSDFDIIKDSFRTSDAPLTGSGQGSARYTIPDDPGLIGQPLYAEGVFDGNGPGVGTELNLGRDRVDLTILP